VTPPAASPLDALREAIQALDAEALLDRHARDRIVTAAIGHLRREQNAARQLRLFGRRPA
jgi:hypothetical protein